MRRSPLEPYSNRHIDEWSDTCPCPRRLVFSGAGLLFAMRIGEPRGESVFSFSGDRFCRPLVGMPRGDMQQGRFVASRLKSSKSFDGRAGASRTLSGVVWCQIDGIAMDGRTQ